MRLGSGGPAKAKPMKIVLDGDKKPVKVKVRKHLAERWEFLNGYLEKLVKMGLIGPC